MDPEDGLAQGSNIKYTKPKDESTNLARELLQAFKRNSTRTLLVDTQSGRQWTGARLLDHCGRVASGLVRKASLKPNDVVMTICDHSDLEVAMAMGVVFAGGAIFGTTPSDGYNEFEVLCSIVKPDLFIVSGQYHAEAARLRQQVPGLAGAKIVWLDDDDDDNDQPARPTTNGHHSEAMSNGGHATDCDVTNKLQESREVLHISDFLAQEADWKLIESIAYEQIDAKQHILTYMLTSGSTGRPKVVPSTHEELIHGLYSMMSACRNEVVVPIAGSRAKQLDDANNNNEELDVPLDENNNGIEQKRQLEGLKFERKTPMMPMGPDDIISGDLPLDHGAGFNTMFLSLWLGSKFIVMPSYDVDAFWQAVSDYQITVSISSTTFCYRLFMRLKGLIEEGRTEKWNLSSFRYISCCGAKLAFIDLVKEVQAHYPHIKVTQAYGCTEIGFISMLHQDDCQTHLQSTGYLFPGLLAKIVHRDEPRRVCAANERGELLLLSRSKFKNYRCHPRDNPREIYAGCHDAQGVFYRTGDQAHFDERGRLYIHGRFKDTLFLMEDWKILPVELEDVINEHPLVEMSVVVGVPDPNLPGCHAPKAFVKLVACDSQHLKQQQQQSNGNIDRELIKRLEANDIKYLERNIYDFVAQRTARPKHLTGGVRILAEFPRVGLLNKVDRKALKLMD